MKRTLTVLLFVMLGLPLAWATVGQQPYTATFTCTGSVGPFAFTYPISDPTSMTVTIDGSIIDSAVYTIVPINNNYNNGGTVTLQSACIAGHILVLNRFTDKTQATVYVANIPIKTTERDLDKSTEIDQEIWGRTVHSIQTQTGGANVGIPSSGGDITYNFTNCTVVGSQVGQVPSTQNLFTVTCPDGGGGSTITGPQYSGVYLASSNTPAFDPRITSNTTSWTSTHTAGIFAPVVTATGPNHAIVIPNGGTEAANTLTMQSGILYNNTTPVGTGSGPGGVAGQVQANGGGGTFSAATDTQKGVVNALTDCGLVGDGVTNDGPAIQACIDAHPGRTILFPDTSGPLFGPGQASIPSYFSGQTLHIQSANGSPGTHIKGSGSTRWTGGTEIAFPANMGGIVVDGNCQGCTISDIAISEQLAGGCFDDNDTSTWGQLPGNGDGIDWHGGEGTISNVRIDCFNGHGLYIIGYSPSWSPNGNGGQPDLWHISDLFTDDNHGHGFAVEGGDSNVGQMDGINAFFNGMVGVYEHSALGNEYHGEHTTGNGRDSGLPGGLNGRKFSSIKRLTNVVTACPLTNVTGFIVGSVIQVTDVQDDASFNGAPFTLTAVTPGASCDGGITFPGSVTWSQTGANASVLPFPGGGMGIITPIATLARTGGNLVTGTTAAPVSNFKNHIWVTLKGTPIDGTYALTSLSGSTFTFRLLGSNFSTPGGNIWVASSTSLIGSADHTTESAAQTQTVLDATVGAGNACSNCLVRSRSSVFGVSNVGASITLACGIAGAPFTTTIASFVNLTAVNLTADCPTTPGAPFEADYKGGWDTGAYYGQTLAEASVWTNPYEESNQPNSCMNSNQIILGGTFNSRNGAITYGGKCGGAPTGVGRNGDFTVPGGHTFISPLDVQTHWQWQAGTNTEQNQIFEIVGHTGIGIIGTLATFSANGDLNMLNGALTQESLSGGARRLFLSTPSNTTFNFNTNYGLATFHWGGNCASVPASIMELDTNGDTTISQPCLVTNVSGNYSSPSLFMAGQFWDGANPHTVYWRAKLLLGTGTTPTATYRLGQDVGGATTTGEVAVNIGGALILDPYTFSALGTPLQVGAEKYCSDCKVTTAATCSTATPASCVCATGGTGAMAKYMNYQANGVGWYCQ